jgi:hypothetical protein
MLLAAALMSANSGTDAATSGIGKMDPSMRAPEASVCGFIREPLAFWLFPSRGRPMPGTLPGSAISNV